MTLAIWQNKTAVQQIFSGQHLAEKTKQAYTLAVQQLFEFLAGRQITPETVKEYFKQLQRKYSPAAVNLKMAGIRKWLLLQAGADHRLAAVVVALFNDTKRVKTENEKLESDYLTFDEYRKVLAFTDEKLSCIVEALFWTGCRVSELLSIKRTDCKINGNVSAKVTGKGSKERTVYFKTELFHRIQAAFTGKSEYLFFSDRSDSGKFNRSSISRAISKAAVKAGINKPVHAHTLRHSLAMYLIHGKHLAADTVAAYLGHSTPAITLQWYCHAKPAAADILE